MLLSFFNWPKPSLVPSKIPSVPLVQSPALPHEKIPNTKITGVTPGSAHILFIMPLKISPFIKKLSDLSKSLPDVIPEASNDDKMAKFGQDLANFDDKTLDKDDLWEEAINPCLKRILGWGTEGNLKNLIWQGRKYCEPRRGGFFTLQR